MHTASDKYTSKQYQNNDCHENVKTYMHITVKYLQNTVLHYLILLTVQIQ